MKKFSLFKQLPCLFAFLFIGIISVFGLSGALPLVAGTTINFPPTDFWVVDHTTPEYAPNNPKGIIGYKPEPDGPNTYQLTDTVPYMTVAMWNKKKIDMNQNWEFDFKLFFGTGNVSFGNNKNKPIGSRDIADGFCFVLYLYNNNSLQNLIGERMAQIGYGGISPSFAIEFDTEWDGYWGGTKIGSSHHIAYLKNGNMAALPGTYKQMQNNWANVGWGKWFDVKIVWRKGYKDNTTYYDLLTYMEERDTTSPQNNGPLLLRDSMRFSSLSDVIAGLEVDSNCQALVTWGVTSATCRIPNHQMVRFTRLTTPDVFVPTVTAVISGRCEETYSPYMIDHGVGVSSLKKTLTPY